MRRLALIALVLLAGCGQTGELFLPGERPAPVSRPATSPAGTETPDDESTQEDDEETPAR